MRVDALVQVVVAEGVRQAQVARGAERLARHDRDLGLVEDDAGELGGRLDGACRGCVRPSTPLTDGYT